MSRDGSAEDNGRPSLSGQHQYEVEQAVGEQSNQINIMIGGGRGVGLPVTKPAEEAPSPAEPQQRRDLDVKFNPHDRKANAFLNVVGTRSNQKRLMPSKTSKYGVGFGHSAQGGGDKSVNAKRTNSAYRRDGSLTLNRQRSSTGQVAFSNATINVNRPRSAV